MKYLLAVLMTASLPLRADICGLYQVEDFGDRMTYMIIQLSPMQTVYTVSNPHSPSVKNMVRGLCYCVSGQVSQDPEFKGDENYRRLNITEVSGPPYGGCYPHASP